MENEILVDTSVIIEHLKAQKKDSTLLYRLSLKYSLCISSIISFELYCGAIDNTKKMKEIRSLVGSFKIYDFTNFLSEISASIYLDLKSKGISIDTNDIFIAATALTNNLRLCTLNTNHYCKTQQPAIPPPVLTIN